MSKAASSLITGFLLNSSASRAAYSDVKTVARTWVNERLYMSEISEAYYDHMQIPLPFQTLPSSAATSLHKPNMSKPNRSAREMYDTIHTHSHIEKFSQLAHRNSARYEHIGNNL